MAGAPLGLDARTKETHAPLAFVQCLHSRRCVFVCARCGDFCGRETPSLHCAAKACPPCDDALAEALAELGPAAKGSVTFCGEGCGTTYCSDACEAADKVCEQRPAYVAIVAHSPWCG